MLLQPPAVQAASQPPHYRPARNGEHLPTSSLDEVPRCTFLPSGADELSMSADIKWEIKKRGGGTKAADGYPVTGNQSVVMVLYASNPPGMTEDGRWQMEDGELGWDSLDRTGRLHYRTQSRQS